VASASALAAAAAASAAVPGNNVHTWGAHGTTLNSALYGTMVRGTTTVTTSAPGGGGSLTAQGTLAAPVSKLTATKAFANGTEQLGTMSAFDGGTPLFFSETARASGVLAAVANATTGAHELWYWNSTYPYPVRHTWTPAAGEVIVELAGYSSVNSSGTYTTYAMLTRRAGTTTVYTWGFNWQGRTGQGSTSGYSGAISGAPVEGYTPTAVAALSGTTVVGIAVGYDFMLAADSTGAVWTWGNDSHGELARSDIAVVSATPVKLVDANTVGGVAPTGVVQVSATGFTAFARTATGVYSWGALPSTSSQSTRHPLGRSAANATAASTPTLLVFPGAGCTPTEVTSGALYWSSVYYYHATVLCAGGLMYGWGNNTHGQVGANTATTPVTTPLAVVNATLNDGETILDIDAGPAATFALTSTGRVLAWGTNIYRQLGITTAYATGSAVNLYKEAVVADRVVADRVTGITVDADSRIYAEGFAAGVLDASGAVWTWGYAGDGLTGRGVKGPAVNTTGSRVDRIGVADGVGVSKVESTSSGTVVVMTDNSVWTWGNANTSVISNGDGTNAARLWPGKIDLPGTIGLPSGTVTINDLSCGGTHCLMSTSDGKVYGWGDGTYKQIVSTSSTTTIYNTPTEITTTTNPAQVAAGMNYSLLVDPGAAGAGGTVQAWGHNASYQAHPSTAGTGTTANCALDSTTTVGCPLAAITSVTAAGTNVIDISAGYYHSVALRADGVVKAWGSNAKSQLGTGTPTQLNPATGDGRIATVTLPTGEAALTIHAALYHTLIRTATGKLVGWGTNSYGAIGNSSTAAVSTPAYTATTVTGTSPITAVDTFGVIDYTKTTTYATETVAIDATGQVWTWGSNVFGQLGASINSGKTSLRDYPVRVQALTVGNFVLGATDGIPVAASGWGAVYRPISTGSAPSAPTVGSATRGDASATLSWTAPTSPRGLRAYTIVARTSASGSIVARAGVGVSATSGTITGLTNGTLYHLSVYATNEHGNSVESGQTTVTPATTPGAPTSLTAQPSAGGITLSFATPASNGGDAITGYTITVTPLAGGAATTRNVSVGSSPYTESFTGLTAGASYSVGVTATNTVGIGTAATVALVIPGRPSTPQTVAAEPRMGGANVTWTAPAYDGSVALGSYYVRAYTAGTTTLIAGTAVSASTLTAALTGLTNGTAYDITVTAAHGSITAATDVPTSQGVESDEVTLTAGRPLAPTGLTATAAAGAVDLTWNQVADVTGIAVTGYVVTYTAGSSATTTTSCATATCSTTITGLTNGTTYSIVVAAQSTGGNGPSSSPAVSATPRTTPGQPATLTATAMDEAADLAWTAPSSTGGSALTGYDVTVSSGATTVGTYAVGADQTGLTVDALENGTAYTISTTARNAAGSGAATTASVTPVGVPSAPRDVAAEPRTTSFDVDWSAPASTGGSAITGYTIVVTDPAGTVTETSSTCATASCTATITQVDDESGTLVNVTTNTRYTVSIRATNAVGDSASTTATVVVPGQPSAPTGVTITDGAGQFHICLLEPTHKPAGAITAYGLSITEDGDDTGLLAVEAASWATGTPCSGSAIGYTVSTLANGAAVQNGSTYAIEVSATSTSGISSTAAYSTDATFGVAATATATPYTSPAVPTAVVATAGDSLLTMTVTAGSARGRAITNYEWSLNSTNGTNGTWTAFSPAQTNGTFLLTGLTNGTAYTPWLRAVNVAGAGTGTSGGSVTPQALIVGGDRSDGAGSGAATGAAGSGATASASTSGSTLRTLTVRTKRKTSIAKILSAAGVKAPKGAKVAIRSTASRKLTITTKAVTAKKDGTYTLTITIKPRKGAATSATLLLVATKSGRMLLG